jgi:hypothetical protein
MIPQDLRVRLRLTVTVAMTRVVQIRRYMPRNKFISVEVHSASVYLMPFCLRATYPAVALKEQLFELEEDLNLMAPARG